VVLLALTGMLACEPSGRRTEVLDDAASSAADAASTGQASAGRGADAGETGQRDSAADGASPDASAGGGAGAGGGADTAGHEGADAAAPAGGADPAAGRDAGFSPNADPNSPLRGAGPVETVVDIGAPGEATFWIKALGKLTVGQRAGDTSILYLVDPTTRTKTPLRMRSNETVGVTIDREGRLIAAEQLATARRVSRGRAPVGMPGYDEFLPYLTESTGGPLGGVAGAVSIPPGQFNRPNDLVMHPRTGALYFTDPWFSGEGPSYPLGKMNQGVFRASPDGRTVVAEAFLTDKPNGIELSPDGKTLYVATRGPDVIHRFPVREDGGLGARAEFAKIGTGNTGYADGLAIDLEGNVYGCTDARGIQVWSAAGKAFGMLPGTNGAKNATFGGADGTTLFFVAGNALKKMAMRIPGLP